MYRKILTLLTILVSACISLIVAYISVKGLVTTFNTGELGLYFFIIIEIGKIILTSGLHTFKESLRGFKIYKFITFSPLRIIGNILVIIAMFVTSIGVYGFLSNGYKKSTSRLSIVEQRKDLIVEKSKLAEGDKTLILEQIEVKKQRIQDQSSIRDQQETRLDSLYARRWYTAAKRTEKAIESANNNIIKLESDIDVLTEKLNVVNDSLTSYNIQTIELDQNNEAATELGTLIYLSDVTGMSMDDVMKWFILVIIVIGDPLAIVLLIIFNKRVANDQKGIDEEIVEIFKTEKVDFSEQIKNKDKILEKAKLQEQEEFDEDHAYDMVLNEMVSDMDISDFDEEEEEKPNLGDILHPSIKDRLGDDYEEERKKALKKIDDYIKGEPKKEELLIDDRRTKPIEESIDDNVGNFVLDAKPPMDFDMFGSEKPYKPLDEFLSDSKVYNYPNETPPPPKRVEPQRLDLTTKKVEENDGSLIEEDDDLVIDTPKVDIKKNLSDGIYHSLLEESDFDEEFLFKVPSKKTEAKKEEPKEEIKEDTPKPQIKRTPPRRRPGNGYMGIRRV
jgi:hypothetical protein